MKSFGVAMAVSMALAAAGTARAQEAASAPSADANTDASMVGEVIVTARKRSESAHDVPISLTVLSGESLESKGIKQIQDVMQFAPDLQQSNGMGGAFRTMRGAGSVGSNLGFEQSTGLFFDEVSYGRNPQSYLPIFDVERVEVLRGPQVITFGNSTTSGAVSIVNRKPGDRFAADASVLQEFYNHQTTVRAGVTLPLGEKASVRVAGFMDQIDKGWIKTYNLGTKDYGPNSDDAAGRITFVADPTDDLQITLKYEHDRTRLNGTNIITTTNALNFPFVPSTKFEPVTYKGSGAAVQSRSGRGGSRQRHGAGTHRLVGGRARRHIEHLLLEIQLQLSQRLGYDPRADRDDPDTRRLQPVRSGVAGVWQCRRVVSVFRRRVLPERSPEFPRRVQRESRGAGAG